MPLRPSVAVELTITHASTSAVMQNRARPLEMSCRAMVVMRRRDLSRVVICTLHLPLPWLTAHGRAHRTLVTLLHARRSASFQAGSSRASWLRAAWLALGYGGGVPVPPVYKIARDYVAVFRPEYKSDLHRASIVKVHNSGLEPTICYAACPTAVDQPC
jgi:hypothetical protein